ncbi:hypothetical protein CVD28_07230 [Bacillus sp. M6-12]|uniref:hypothetical protein n=1 Tax=Bacillus sp. M6-12 TaxID=2054166 RepID=UPI000C7629B1|nr:hypothetical protein [Bacillus sp. M6-12]PLS18448.1 hypothetical protein CVD28_07230 [Bacillus sp. M6-12]
MKQESIKLLIDELLLASGSQVKVSLEKNYPGDRFAGGKYSMGSHTITLYIEEIEQQCLQLFSSLDHFMDYLAVVFAHEIGHAEDKELLALANKMDESSSERERQEIALQIEENAWDYAVQLLPHLNPDFVDEIKENSLEPYWEQLGQEPALV